MNNEEAAHLLIEQHANVDAQDEHNQTALFLAAREGSLQVAAILLHRGKANADLPDHMERFPRSIAVDRQHHDIAQLIDEFSRGSGATLAFPQAAGGPIHPQAPAGKSRSKKSSTSQQRKQSARSAVGGREDHGLLRHGEIDAAAAAVHVVHPQPKKTTKRRQRPALQSAGAASHQTQSQAAAKLYNVLIPRSGGQMGLGQFGSPEQPPSYEKATNGRRAQFAAMQAVDPRHPLFHTAVAFDDPQQQQQQQFDATSAEMAAAYAGGLLASADLVEFHHHQRQPTGVVLQPGSFLHGRRVDADPNQLVHHHGGSPTVPSCHACSPPTQSVLPPAAAQGRPDATEVGLRGQQHPVSPLHRQVLQQTVPPIQNLYQHHQPCQQQQHRAPPADVFNVPITAFLPAIEADPGATAYPTPTPSTAGANINGLMFQYPTPPGVDTTSPPLGVGGSLPNGYQTPSPEESLPAEPSPRTWCGDVSNSATSDWSEHASRNNASGSSPRRALPGIPGHSIKHEPDGAYL